MNMHCPQSYEAAVELEDIAAIPHNIVTPRHARPLIGVFQDSVVGSYRLTRPGVEFTRKEFMNLMMRNKRFTGTLPAPRGTNGKFTGQQVISQLLPSINMEMKNKSDGMVKIVQGDIREGTLDSDVYMKAGKGIIHVTFNDYGPKETTALLDSLQRVVEDALVLNGFSVGISDLVADDATKKEMVNVIRQQKELIEQVQLQVHSDLFENNTGKTNQQEFEDQAFSILDKARDEAGKGGEKSLSEENRLVAMVKSGSKGGADNIAQMIACLGQQSIEGKRIPYGLTDRTLPHYKKYDDGAEARGFIESSFIRGLTPQEFFFHAMTGREGLIDTAVKSVTGDTPIVVQENGVTRRVRIGDWIDGQLAAHSTLVEHFEERNMEMLQLETPVYIPTADGPGNVSWGEIKAITRHDPGTTLYRIKTAAGKTVTVTESQSLLVYNQESHEFVRTTATEVCIGQYVPTTVTLAEPPIMASTFSTGAEVLPFTEENGRLLGERLAKENEKGVISSAIAMMFGASTSFVQSFLKAYFTSAKYTHNAITVESESDELLEGISMLCTRIGIFSVIAAGSLVIRGSWANRFAKTLNIPYSFTESERNEFVVQNNVVLDPIVEIEPLDASSHPKVYDLTVPSTWNFGLANGLHVVDTADTGYIQRQLIKGLEDLVVQHDGTVRDANMKVIQFAYGEDGIAATKLETQDLSLAKLSVPAIQQEFGMQTVEWASVLEEGVARDGEAEAEAVKAFVADVLEDQRMIVEGVYQGSTLDANAVNAPVNLARMILNTKIRFGIVNTQKTSLTADYVLKGIGNVLSRTKGARNRMWSALVRFTLAPHKLVVKERFTKDAFDALCELIVVNHMKSWVQPGEQVGIVAAQSIGEPSTQLTLNSVDWMERIVIAKDGKVWTPMIGEFIDKYLASCDPKRVQYLEKGQIYIDLKDDGHCWKAASCDEDGVMQWTTLEAITKHPVVNEDGTDTILEVELESGRTVRATKGKSFLTVVDGKLKATDGSDLEVGDKLPCAASWAIDQVETVKTLSLRETLPPTKWIYGTEVATALMVMAEEDTKGCRHWFGKNQGNTFTVPYSRSDSFRDAFTKGKNPYKIEEGYVYPKCMRREPSRIPETILLDAEFGFFCGAYLAEGMSNRTQVNITNNDKVYLERVRALMDRWSVGTHLVEGAKHASGTTEIKGYTTSLIIHSTILAKVMGTLFGRLSYNKTIPDWVLQAPDEFVKALVDGYISGDGCVSLSGEIAYSSVSEDLITMMNAIMARYGIWTAMSKYMPKLGKFKSVHMQYKSRIGVHHATLFANQFTLCIPKKQERLNVHLASGAHPFRRTVMKDTVLDKIKSIKEVHPIKGFVYDLTVEKTRNFVLLNTVCCRDTFHMAGVASKSNVTQGIPRLRELLKVTKKPKATSLTIYLKPEYRNSKEKARELVQDLELTLLRNITNKVAIFWDPKDSTTIVAEDKEMLDFYRILEDDTVAEGSVTKSPSKWLLRLELNREEMFNKNISMSDVVFMVRAVHPEVSVVYNDYNSEKLVMRIRIPTGEDKDADGDTPVKLDDFTALKRFQNKLLNNTVIRGVPGIKAVTFRQDKQKSYMDSETGEYKTLDQYILDTDGTNYQMVMNHPAVDATRLYSTNIYDVMDILGLEAVRAILMMEMAPIFATAAVNYRHLGLLCDHMTTSGRLMSIDRYGINKNDIGPLAKMSFEETTKVVMKAAQFGEVDPVTGVSANIMIGQPIRGGTAFSQILLDDQALSQLQQGLGPLAEEDEEEMADIDDLLTEELMDPCSTAQFQMSISMPPKVKGLQEPDVEVYMLDEA